MIMYRKTDRKNWFMNFTDEELLDVKSNIITMGSTYGYIESTETYMDYHHEHSRCYRDHTNTCELNSNLRSPKLAPMYDKWTSEFIKEMDDEIIYRWINKQSTDKKS